MKNYTVTLEKDGINGEPNYFDLHFYIGNCNGVPFQTNVQFDMQGNIEKVTTVFNGYAAIRESISAMKTAIRKEVIKAYQPLLS